MNPTFAPPWRVARGDRRVVGRGSQPEGDSTLISAAISVARPRLRGRDWSGCRCCRSRCHDPCHAVCRRARFRQGIRADRQEHGDVTPPGEVVGLTRMAVAPRVAANAASGSAGAELEPGFVRPMGGLLSHGRTPAGLIAAFDGRSGHAGRPVGDLAASTELLDHARSDRSSHRARVLGEARRNRHPAVTSSRPSMHV